VSQSHSPNPTPELVHEIRTALHTLVGVTGLLTATRLDDEQAEYVDAIRMGTDRILSLIDEDAHDSLPVSGDASSLSSRSTPALPSREHSGAEAHPADTAVPGAPESGAIAKDASAPLAPKHPRLQEQARRKSDQNRGTPINPGGRVLIVEDNMINRRVMVRLMDRMGYKADAAVDGIDALDAVGRRSYDLIFMDLQMPRMGGLEAIAAIRERQDENRPWIIALTAAVSDEDRAASERAGADDFLAKPVRADEIKAAMQRVSGLTREDRQPKRRSDTAS
jgi:CheY-like chemotaxis protein